MYVASMIFGVENASFQMTQKLIHGSQPKSGQNIRKENLVGVKHFATNKLRLQGQKKHYDDSPNVLIIPILDLNAMKQWNGDGYDALFLIGFPIDETERGDIILESTVVGTGFSTHGQEATRDEIEMARNVLDATVLALTFSINKMIVNKDQFNDAQRELLNPLTPPIGESDIAKCPRKLSVENQRVQKVTFASLVDSGAVGGHPAPDPMLLAVKAANNWSAAQGRRLLAVAETEEDEMSERSLLALDIHFAVCNEMKKREMDEVIPGMYVSF